MSNIIHQKIPNNIPHKAIQKVVFGPNWIVPVKIVVASGTGKQIGWSIHKNKNIKYFITSPTPSLL